MKGLFTGIAAGWLVVGGIAHGQEERGPDEVTAPEIPAVAAPTAALTLRDGRTVEGPVVIAGGKLVVSPEGGVPIAAGLEELRSVVVRLPDPDREEAAAPSLLTGALPAPWRSKDLGRLAVPGRARWKDHQFVLSASREADGERFSAMHLAYQPIEGDGEIVARVVSIEGPEEESFGGIIMCDGLTPENRKAMLEVQFRGEGRVNFRRWGYQGGSSTGQEDPAIKPPFWLKLVREEFDVKAYYSPDGRRWRFLKEDPGKMRDEQIYVGLVARSGSPDQLQSVVIDNVSINGVGSQPSDPMLPHIILRGGSRLAADLLKADATSFHFRGRWKDLVLTAPQVARVEFFHPLPRELARRVDGERAGLLLRSGDFSEGEFQSLEDGRIVMGSVLFGVNEFSILDQADALVLRKVAEPAEPPVLRLETHAGSILLAQKAALVEGDLLVHVAGLGELRLAVDELARLEMLGSQ